MLCCIFAFGLTRSAFNVPCSAFRVLCFVLFIPCSEFRVLHFAFNIIYYSYDHSIKRFKELSPNTRNIEHGTFQLIIKNHQPPTRNTEH